MEAIGEGGIAVEDEDLPFYDGGANRHYEEMEYRAATRLARDRVREAEETRSYLLGQLRDAAADRLLGVDVPDSVFEELEAAEERYAQIARRYYRGYERLADETNVRPSAETHGNLTGFGALRD